MKGDSKLESKFIYMATSSYLIYFNEKLLSIDYTLDKTTNRINNFAFFLIF